MQDLESLRTLNVRPTPLFLLACASSFQVLTLNSRGTLTISLFLSALQASWLLANVENGKVYVEAADVEDALSEVFEYG